MDVYECKVFDEMPKPSACAIYNVIILHTI